MDGRKEWKRKTKTKTEQLKAYYCLSLVIRGSSVKTIIEKLYRL
jgi:hypothetical protein